VNRRGRLSQMMLGVFGTLFALGASSVPCAATQNLHLTPQTVTIGSFFNGAQLTVSGEIPEKCAAVVEVIGKVVERELMRKGRRWDLWMNVGEIDVDGVPRLYLVMSSDTDLLPGDGGDRLWGYEALRKRVSFKGIVTKEETSKLFTEFIRLRESQGLYGRFPGALKISSSNETGSIAQGIFRLPARLFPGTYQVCLTVIREGQIIERRSIPLNVVRVGFPALLAPLASEHAVLYGLLSVAVAVASGFLCGLLFRVRRRSRSEGEDQG
jgi:uncharacterized protein (TIGR02186 family)